MFIITLVGRIPASARIRPEIDFLLHNQKMLGEEEEDGTSSQVTPHTRGLASAPEQEELFHSRPGTFYWEPLSLFSLSRSLSSQWEEIPQFLLLLVMLREKGGGREICESYFGRGGWWYWRRRGNKREGESEAVRTVRKHFLLFPRPVPPQGCQKGGCIAGRLGWKGRPSLRFGSDIQTEATSTLIQIFF